MSTRLSQLPPAPPGKSGWPWTEETPPSLYAKKKDWPRISIVTPSFNQAGYIEETIRSILLQNYPDLQYLVIDGGSTDGTVEILKKYSPWLHHWESKPDRGQSHAINKGLARSDGRWFNWINSDDCLLPGALAAVASAEPSIVVVSGAQSTGENLSDPVPLGRTRIGPTLEETLVNHFICQQGLFFRTDVIKELLGVSEELHYIMDLDLFMRVLLKEGLESVAEIPDVVAFFRRHEQAKTALSGEKFHQEERRLFHGLGYALQLDERLLQRLSGPTAPPSSPARLSLIDRGRLSELLGLKFWWDGPVETAWGRRDFKAFKEELAAFTRAFPAIENPRITRLRRMARLPVPLLGLISLFRTNAPAAP